MRSTQRSTLWLWIVALLPLLLLGGAAALRWQRRRSGERRRQESLAQPGAVRATLHVYGEPLPAHPHALAVSHLRQCRATRLVRSSGASDRQVQ